MKCDRQVMEEMQGYLEEAKEAIEHAENWATASALNNILKVVQFLLDNVESRLILQVPNEAINEVDAAMKKMHDSVGKLVNFRSHL